MASLSLPPPRKSVPTSSLLSNPASSSLGAAHTSTNLMVTGSPTGNTATATATAAATISTKAQRAPAYDERCLAAGELAKLTPVQRKEQPRKLFVPRTLQDFDDGGAFPEIHVAQYPRHMGNPHLKKKSSNVSRAIVNVEVDETGEVSYDAIVKGGTNSDKKVYSRLEDLQPREAKKEDVALPTEEDEQATANRTQMALAKLLASQTALDKPSGSAMVNAETSKNMEAKTQFIKYTPRPDAPGYNPAASQRVIQMVPAQVDPMMPPKHKHVKAPRGPAEDPVPVLHAPPQKLSKEERDAWNVPACISNWKNTRGYTIPLDKRLAADGRGLREHTINSNFSTLSESLYVAERQARQEVRMRAQVHKKLSLQEKDLREEELRALANQARLERSGFSGQAAGSAPNPNDDSDEEKDKGAGAGAVAATSRPIPRDNHSDYGGDGDRRKPAVTEETDDDVAARQRERLRKERRREREKDLRQENNMEIKKRKMEAERDVSEKVALGVHTGTGGGAGEVDARLYNQSAGMDSGFGAEDEYNTYSKPLFGDRASGATSSSVYRPTRGETEYNADESYDKLVKGSTSKFQPAKGFAGAEGGGEIQAGPRSAPVQFEKSKN